VPDAVIQELYNLNSLTLVGLHDVFTAHLEDSDSHGVLFTFRCESDGGQDVKVGMNLAASASKTRCHDMAAGEDVFDGALVTLHFVHHEGVFVQDSQHGENWHVSELKEPDVVLNLVN